MAFALNHARTHGLERIIYVIPFTSIIEQNAAVFREALGELGTENILEHHSNYDWEAGRQTSDDETLQVQAKLRLASENWDIPIVVTTNVQFFESLFASKKSQARKLHNIAKSVIIFDASPNAAEPLLEALFIGRAGTGTELRLLHGILHGHAAIPAGVLPGEDGIHRTGTQSQALFDFFHRVQVKTSE